MESTPTAPSNPRDERRAVPACGGDVGSLGTTLVATCALLALVAVCASLRLLRGFDAPPPSSQSLTDEHGGQVTLVVDAKSVSAPGGAAFAPRIVMSRTRFELDLRRSRIRFADGRERVIPDDAGIVLVDATGRVEALAAAVGMSPVLAFRILEAAARAARGTGVTGAVEWAEWFTAPENRPSLGASAERVVAFWSVPRSAKP